MDALEELEACSRVGFEEWEREERMMGSWEIGWENDLGVVVTVRVPP